MPGKLVVIQLNPDELTDTEMIQALKYVKLKKGKKGHQGKNFHKYDQ